MMELEELKTAYDMLKKKYNLPGFREMNECFEIDRNDRETDHLLREIRKLMMDKVIGYIRFLEMVINPANAPPMFLVFVKQITGNERKLLEEVYQSFVELELESLRLEIDYSEKAEAESIRKIFATWEKMRPQMRDVVGVLERNWNTTGSKKVRSYFG